MSARQKRLVVVLGMHRSGTSAIARGLLVLKVSLGHRLMDAVADVNDKGFWEDVDITDFNVELLTAIGSDWHDLTPMGQDELALLRGGGYPLRAVELLRGKIGDAPVYGFKDPRVARLLPFWDEVFTHLGVDVSYVLVVRHPLSVVRSLTRRDGFEAEKSYLLWLGHVMESLAGSAGHRRVVVDYDRLMANAELELTRVAVGLGLTLDPKELRSYQEEFLDEQLRHTVHAASDLLLDGACPELVREVYACLLEVASGRVDLESPALQADCAAWIAEFERYRPSLSLADKLYLDRGRARRDIDVRDRDIAQLTQLFQERESRLHEVTGEVIDLRHNVTGCEARIASLSSQVVDLTGALSKREANISELNGVLAECNMTIAALDKSLVERDAQAQNLATALSERDAQAQNLATALSERDGQAQNLATALSERDGQVAALTHGVAERDAQIAHVKAELVVRDRMIAEHASQVNALLKSNSWRMTAVFRWFSTLLRSVFMINRVRLRLLRSNLVKSGLFDEEFYLREYPDVRSAGISPLQHYLEYGWREGRDPSLRFSTRQYLERNPDVASAKVNPLVHYALHGRREQRAIYSQAVIAPAQSSWQNASLLGRAKTALSMAIDRPELVARLIVSLRQKGVRATLAAVTLHVRRADRQRQHEPAVASVAGLALAVGPDDDFLIPLYLNPFRKDGDSARFDRVRALVVAAIDGENDLLMLARALDNVPCEFDLVLVASNKHIAGALGARIPKPARLRRIEARPTSRDGSALVALLASVAGDVESYSVIGCFDARSGIVSSRGGQDSAMWGEMLGSRNGVAEIFDTILNDGRVVLPGVDWRRLLDFPASRDKDGGAAVPVTTSEDLRRIDDYLREGRSFWMAGAVCGLSTQVLADGADPAAATRLAALIRRCKGRDYVVFDAATLPPGPAFENQIDYEKSIRPDGVKVLSFYLPQFHPIPENDEWHGKGFTEWHKVRAANPLFAGHYQQHVPHRDLGYYLLDSTAVLKQQSEMMKRAGVYGQIFYHYWFGGRLILEKAAQMLLGDSSIDMPFCFCWANENWTRRWDGNEQEVLLGQKYGADDAEGFIRYLIPFFKDPRYIKVCGRPVVFIYRPSSIEGMDTYREVWARICCEEGLPKPYIVATLTRGATDPRNFGMDAGCERVLHDWTDGAVRNLASDLVAYRSIDGSILNYGDVARFYMSQTPKKDFVYMRTIIPIWDNTARYDSRAYVVHDSSPAKFQAWLESLVEDARARLGQEERFIVVNAWNEWAEGAHLEPDVRFGYAYLNAVGRALSGISYGEREYLTSAIPQTTSLKLTIAPSLLKDLASSDSARAQFSKCLQESSVLGACAVFADQSLRELAGFADNALKVAAPGQRYDFELRISRFCLFDADTIANLLRMAIAHGGCSVTPTHANDAGFSHEGQEQGVVAHPSEYMYLVGHGSPVLKCCVDAPLFVARISPGNTEAPVVSSILRFHKSGSVRLLSRALYSLAAQAGCRVRPIVAAQDLTADASAALECLCQQIPWAAGCDPVITHYSSTEATRDIRSTMLNESLRSVRDRYAAFLDYDDVVFCDAYEWLIGRLNATGKNATFGIVYSTEYDPLENRIGKRSVVFDYGCDYLSFVGHNHSPIHSFMLDMSKIDAQAIKYFPDMKYMEDYFMTLQIFSEHGTDWDSLEERRFVGDYYHHVRGTGENTLALVDDAKRSALLSDPEYVECERRIRSLREKVMLERGGA